MGQAPTLSIDQRRALDRLSGLPVIVNLYLASATAFGIHLGHRRSGRGPIPLGDG